MLVDYFPYNNNGGERNEFSIGIPVTETILHLCLWSLIIEEVHEVLVFEIHFNTKMADLFVRI
jgi:hypothetical protein